MLLINKSRLFFLFAIVAALLMQTGAAVSRPKLQVGVFLPTSETRHISDFEATVGRHQDIIMYFQAWDDGYGGGFDVDRAQNVVGRGSIPMVTWEPWSWGGDGANQPLYSLKSITSGKHDDYIRLYARSVKQVNGPVYVRLMHEMNGNWYPWAGSANGNRPEDFVPAFRHIVDIWRQEQVSNVRWVWAPNNVGLPDWGTSSFRNYYPGDDYVDFAGVDGYNFGATSEWPWTSFPSVFSDAYREITGFTDKPIIIAETASAESGGDKAGWIKQAFDVTSNSYPQVVALIWFNENKETDWRVESSAASINAYRAAMAKLSILQADVSRPKISVSAPSRVRAHADNTRKVLVRWSASDPSPSSGIAKYKVQVKSGLKRRWKTWPRATRSRLKGYFPARGGHTYYFRVQAVDRAGNRSAWSAVKKTLVRRQII